MFKNSSAVAITLWLSATGARANDEPVQFKDYSFGLSAAQLKSRYGFLCARPKANPAVPSKDPALRTLEKDGLQLFMFQSGEMTCVPRKDETAVGLPVKSEFALFSDRLERVTIWFQRGPYDRLDRNWDKEIEMGTLIAGLSKRYGKYESLVRRICPLGLCGTRGSDEFTYLWTGKDGHVTLTFRERPSTPATLQYTSLRFESESSKYKERLEAVHAQEHKRHAELNAAENAGREKDF